MKRLPFNTKVHRSTSDWESIIIGGGSWALDPVLYVSAPSSLQLKADAHDGGWWYSLMLCKLPGTLNLKQGRMITQCHDFSYTLPDYRRRGYIIGYADVDHFMSFLAPFHPVTFTKSRLTWWESYNLLNEPKLATRVDTWIDGAWVESEIVYHSLLTGDVRRCGLFAATSFWSGLGCLCNFDDTEIWI